MAIKNYLRFQFFYENKNKSEYCKIFVVKILNSLTEHFAFFMFFNNSSLINFSRVNLLILIIIQK